VNVEPATLRELDITASSVGTVEAAESILVTSPVTGTVRRLHFGEGQRVEAGAPLVELDAAAEFAALEAAQAELQDARSQQRRLSRLAGSGAVSQSVLDEAQARLNTARARVDEGRAELDDRRITAPFAGTVGLAQVSPGAVVQPGDPIATLATVAQLKLAFRLPSQWLPRLRPGLAVRARIQGLQEELAGRITRIDNAVDTATRSIALEAALPEARYLRPGMFAAVDVVLETREAVTVPEEAIVLEGEQAYVYTVGDDRRAVRQPVAVGERRLGFAEIREGLTAGARVVTAGVQKVMPGQPVTLPDATRQPPGAPS
jgi:membrane fusion protein (multidrug efflux system)